MVVPQVFFLLLYQLYIKIHRQVYSKDIVKFHASHNHITLDYKHLGKVQTLEWTTGLVHWNELLNHSVLAVGGGKTPSFLQQLIASLEDSFCLLLTIFSDGLSCP